MAKDIGSWGIKFQSFIPKSMSKHFVSLFGSGFLLRGWWYNVCLCWRWCNLSRRMCVGQEWLLADDIGMFYGNNFRHFLLVMICFEGWLRGWGNDIWFRVRICQKAKTSWIFHVMIWVLKCGYYIDSYQTVRHDNLKSKMLNFFYFSLTIYKNLFIQKSTHKIRWSRSILQVSFLSAVIWMSGLYVIFGSCCTSEQSSHSEHIVQLYNAAAQKYLVV